MQAHETYSRESLHPSRSNLITPTVNDPICETINELTSGSSSNATVISSTSYPSSTDSSNTPSFSEEVFEEREGSGGAVHKVSINATELSMPERQLPLWR